MKLFHTSPVEIKKITKTGMFGDCLFFALSPYGLGNIVNIYSVDASEMSFVSASSLYDEEIVSRIAKCLAVDLDTAESLLDGSETVWDIDVDMEKAEADWWIQELRGECAKKMGYDGCEDEDEQGSVYIIPMFGREEILVLEGDNWNE